MSTRPAALVADVQLVDDLYLRPTPLGAFHAVSSRAETPAINVLRGLLRTPVSPKLATEELMVLGGVDALAAKELLFELQEQKWVQGHEQPVEPAGDSLEVALPRMLPPLSSRGRVLLADEQGFCLTSVGFDSAVAPELSALSADLASTVTRHASELRRVAGLDSGAWAVVDGFGNSQLGFWPLFIGGQRFVLAIAGLPRLNQPEFTDLISSLSTRYDRGEAFIEDTNNQGDNDA